MGPQSGLQIMASSSCYIPCASGGRRSTLCSNVNQKHILKSHLWHSPMRINSSKWGHEIKYVSGRGLLASVFLSWWSRSKYWSSICQSCMTSLAHQECPMLALWISLFPSSSFLTLILIRSQDIFLTPDSALPPALQLLTWLFLPWFYSLFPLWTWHIAQRWF